MIRVAIFGMGGFARVHHEAIRALEAEGLVKLVATCDPGRGSFPQIEEDLRTRGVEIYADYRTVLNTHSHELDCVTIATPIPFHAPMHLACVRRGIAVYLEKPPTLDWRELESMIRVDCQAGKASQVGFNFIGEPARQRLKTRLQSGEFGKLREAGFTAFWPRPASYFTRSPWSGKLRHEDQFVLDSCVGNALAHYAHNLPFWAGQEGLLSWGSVDAVEAELYRAQEIESFDTAFARAQSGEVQLHLAATHAGIGPGWQREWIVCDDAEITYLTRGGGWEISWQDGQVESGVTDTFSTAEILTANLRHYCGYLTGKQERPLTTLTDSRPFVQLHSLLFAAANHITRIEDSHINSFTNEVGDSFVAIHEIEASLRHFETTGEFPSEAGVLWGELGGRADISALEDLDHCIDALLTAQPTPIG